MSLLSSHLEQIAYSSQSIAELPFPPPQIFTNALLSRRDITSLIRDTEPHERALFSVPPPPPRNAPSATPNPEDEKKKAAGRRQTVFAVAQGEIVQGNAGTGIGERRGRKGTAVAAVLGPDLHASVFGASSQAQRNQADGEVDVEVLLRGAEKLGEVVEVPGLGGRVAELRARYARVVEGVRYYEEKVARQQVELEQMHRGGDDFEDEEMGGGDEGQGGYGDDGGDGEITDEMLWQEEEEIRELERRKRELEERVSGMERDLGGLTR